VRIFRFAFYRCRNSGNRSEQSIVIASQSYVSCIARSRLRFSIYATAWGAILLGTALFTSGDQARAYTDQNRQDGIWRSHQNDGLNCLYMQLRILGYRGTYEEYRAAAARHGRLNDAEAIAAAARAFGVRLALKRFTPEELSQSKLPAIIHLDQHENVESYFALWIGDDPRNERFVLLYPGGRATVIVYRKELFQRDWTGYALVPDLEPASDSGWLLSAAIFAALCGGILLTWQRSSRRGIVAQANGSA